MQFIEHAVEDGTFEVEMSSGKQLMCLICGHNLFHERSTLLNTRVAAIFHIDWANPEAKNFVCSRCGYIHWFLP
jgi:predicted nucleic-acid-binding Zn-ribbon protein